MQAIVTYSQPESEKRTGGLVGKRETARYFKRSNKFAGRKGKTF